MAIRVDLCLRAFSTVATYDQTGLYYMFTGRWISYLYNTPQLKERTV
jgi:hypothetical protein